MDGMPKKPCGRKQHAPTDAQRKLVELHATVGTTQDMIARVIGIDKKTLNIARGIIVDKVLDTVGNKWQ